MYVDYLCYVFCHYFSCFCFFFFQAEDGIRDKLVTGVQTCALPIFGTIGAFYRANLDLTSKIPKFNLFDAEAPVYTRARYLPPSKIEETEINDSIISDGCIINGAKVTNSVVGLRSRISKGVQLDASFMMGADFYQTFDDMRNDASKGLPRVGLGEGSVVRRAIIDKNARIGKHAKLLNEA